MSNVSISYFRYCIFHSTSCFDVFVSAPNLLYHSLFISFLFAWISFTKPFPIFLLFFFSLKNLLTRSLGFYEHLFFLHILPEWQQRFHYNQIISSLCFSLIPSLFIVFTCLYISSQYRLLLLQESIISPFFFEFISAVQFT